ncbi:BatA domain-containing protein [Paludisphaera mucosa]|uniref:BatA domain-containing protein n=1 Tax=Paludisphaera mucosa TaxID=3030827 RepID=A0ABT6F9V9_9BACT|nr:BatA domain-containing protein [Paludisphaera mucosa]MDG3004349.1 BatA domain-containing protein [Paludisphaera mucosa]
MSFLTPFFILGGLAVAAPILFHLIRRTTRSEMPFSSLIFLAPSPPRVTRRSRLEHWPLLLLRAAALAILAAAFARPFLRQTAAQDLGDVGRSRTALLIDVSASMRRGTLWSKAVAKALEVVAGCGPQDELAVLAFDASSRPVLGFAEWASLDPAQRQAAARSRIEALAPSWGATRLGQALIDAAGAIEDLGDAARASARVPRRIVLVSDLQQGSRLDALGDFDWPSDLELDARPVAAEGSNAAAEWLAPSDDDARPDALRVRVSNDPNSKRESFSLSWVDDKEARPIPVYVPPGESRVVRVPRPTAGPARTALRLEGDAHSFDDVLYLAADPEQPATVLFVGPDEPDDPEGLLYYLGRVFDAAPGRAVKVERRAPGSPLAIAADPPPALVVLAAETSPGDAASLAEFAKRGGTVLAVVAAGRAATLAAAAEVPAFDVVDAEVRGDAMLGEIAFDHPLFASVSAPQFNDFTKIRFRRYRRLPADALGEARVVARFENGDPAVIEKRLGKGRLVVFASGWKPADGWLARSSKFVPLMSALLDGPGSGEAAGPLLVGGPIPLPEGAVAVHKPDGSTVRVEPGTAAFRAAEAPGVYGVDAPGGPRRFAVNLDPLESRTAPLGVEALEQAGCRLVRSEASAEVEREATRQLQNAELEGRQKLWRPLILLAIAVLIVETWLAGRLGRARPIQAGASAP